MNDKINPEPRQTESELSPEFLAKLETASPQEVSAALAARIVMEIDSQG